MRAQSFLLFLLICLTFSGVQAAVETYQVDPIYIRHPGAGFACPKALAAVTRLVDLQRAYVGFPTYSEWEELMNQVRPFYAYSAFHDAYRRRHAQINPAFSKNSKVLFNGVPMQTVPDKISTGLIDEWRFSASMFEQSLILDMDRLMAAPFYSAAKKIREGAHKAPHVDQAVRMSLKLDQFAMLPQYSSETANRLAALADSSVIFQLKRSLEQNVTIPFRWETLELLEAAFGKSVLGEIPIYAELHRHRPASAQDIHWGGYAYFAESVDQSFIADLVLRLIEQAYVTATARGYRASDTQSGFVLFPYFRIDLKTDPRSGRVTLQINPNDEYSMQRLLPKIKWSVSSARPAKTTAQLGVSAPAPVSAVIPRVQKSELDLSQWTLTAAVRSGLQSILDQNPLAELLIARVAEVYHGIEELQEIPHWNLMSIYLRRMAESFDPASLEESMNDFWSIADGVSRKLEAKRQAQERLYEANRLGTELVDDSNGVEQVYLEDLVGHPELLVAGRIYDFEFRRDDPLSKGKQKMKIDQAVIDYLMASDQHAHFLDSFLMGIGHGSRQRGLKLLPREFYDPHNDWWKIKEMGCEDRILVRKENGVWVLDHVESHKDMSNKRF